LAFVGDDDARTLAGCQVLFHGVGEMMHIDDRVLDAGFRQAVEAVIDQ